MNAQLNAVIMHFLTSTSNFDVKPIQCVWNCRRFIKLQIWQQHTNGVLSLRGPGERYRSRNPVPTGSKLPGKCRLALSQYLDLPHRLGSFRVLVHTFTMARMGDCTLEWFGLYNFLKPHDLPPPSSRCVLTLITMGL